MRNSRSLSAVMISLVGLAACSGTSSPAAAPEPVPTTAPGSDLIPQIALVATRRPASSLPATGPGCEAAIVGTLNGISIDPAQVERAKTDLGTWITLDAEVARVLSNQPDTMVGGRCLQYVAASEGSPSFELDAPLVDQLTPAVAVFVSTPRPTA